MRSQDQTTPASAATRLSRRFVRQVASKLLAVIAIDFLAMRILGPELIDLHDDLALLGAITCFAIALIATGWLIVQLLRDHARYQQARRELTPSLPFSQED